MVTRSVISPTIQSSRCVWKKSWCEYNHKKKLKKQNELKKTLMSGNLKRGETGTAKTRSYGCAICRKPGHRYKCCPEVMDHGIPLDVKNIAVRQRLCERLSSGSMSILTRKKEDQRNVKISVPKSVIGVIIHNIYKIDDNSCREKFRMGWECLHPIAIAKTDVLK